LKTFSKILNGNAVNGHQRFTLISETATKKPQFGFKKTVLVPPNPPLERHRFLRLLFSSDGWTSIWERCNFKLSHCQLLSCQQQQYSSWPMCCRQCQVERWV